MRFTKAHAEQALTDNGETWESPFIDIVDTLTEALEDHYLRQGRRIDTDDVIERAENLAAEWAE